MQLVALVLLPLTRLRSRLRTAAVGAWKSECKTLVAEKSLASVQLSLGTQCSRPNALLRSLVQYP